jgi:hypothetical protein
MKRMNMASNLHCLRILLPKMARLDPEASPLQFSLPRPLNVHHLSRRVKSVVPSPQAVDLLLPLLLRHNHQLPRLVHLPIQPRRLQLSKSQKAPQPPREMHKKLMIRSRGRIKVSPRQRQSLTPSKPVIVHLLSLPNPLPCLVRHLPELMILGPARLPDRNR